MMPFDVASYSVYSVGLSLLYSLKILPIFTEFPKNFTYYFFYSCNHPIIPIIMLI